MSQPVHKYVEHVNEDHSTLGKNGWPQFVVMPESGFEEVHRGSADVCYQRNTAIDLAKRLNRPVFVFIAVEKWMPDGTIRAPGA